ncbi:DUF2254 domain-containing protein [Erythrobacter sp. JK5]|uniref:DUF2254 domain-containing protein n=1 Tax=Erythrobacter sp. JK5 TaxID=2829500 RepID=UPI001BA92344|nr:DUF2254 domain-containing protein [Erythrobacter sp. JK5]QUL36703.1 DUF2254 domain-containing protein [Erythrobacter sp. JK5]
MTAQLRFWLARLRANYWFYPTLFSVVGAILGFTMVALDRAGFGASLEHYEWLVPVRPSGAADILSVMASSMIAIASTVFSITIVAVSFASGTYGPRLLANFLEDRGNQISLGTFVGTFVYAMIVLRSVRSEDETPVEGVTAGADMAASGFTPQLGVLVAYFLMALCIGVLVFFLNHVPSSIRINKVLESIGERLIAAIRDKYPVENEFSDARPSEGGDPLLGEDTGYIQMIDYDALEQVARDCGGTFSLSVRTGDFVHRGLPLMDVDGCDPDAVAEAVRDAFTLGPVRTPEQDPQFLIDELVEIGLRALSPGINDPFTAITALHWLGAATSEIGRRDLRKDACDDDSDTDADRCPVIPCADGFEHYVTRGFGAIRSAVATSVTASQVMFDTLANAAAPIRDEGRLRVLREQGKLLIEQARTVLEGPDLDLIEQRHEAFDRTFWR